MQSARTPVLFFNSPGKPGADTRIQALIMRALDRERFEVHVACTAQEDGSPSPSLKMLSAIPRLAIRPTNFGPSLSKEKGSRQLLLALGGASAVGSLLGLAAYVRRHRIRILHSSERPRDALPCVLIAKLTGAKCVIHLHVGWGDWMSRQVRWALRHADALIGVSGSVAGSILAAGQPRHKVHAVLNAMDLDGFDPSIPPGPVRRELGLPEGVPVVVSISRLFHWKGHADLLRALAIVRRAVPETRLVIVGEEDMAAGGLDRPTYVAELKQLARDLGVEDHVLFTGFRADVARMLAAADVFALPSFQEPFGLVFLEAMAMKRPVVALDSGGTPEVVEHGKSGLLSPARDVDALAANLLALIRDPALRARMGEHGRRSVETRFTPARLARDVERIYAGLCAGGAALAPAGQP